MLGFWNQWLIEYHDELPVGPPIENLYKMCRSEQHRLTPKYYIFHLFVSHVKCFMSPVYTILRINSKLPVIVVMGVLYILRYVYKYSIFPSSILIWPVLIFTLNILIKTIISFDSQEGEKLNVYITVSLKIK